MTAKRERVAREVRAAILRGDYEDGHHLSQRRLAAEFDVDRSVVWYALTALRDEGHVSRDNRNRFYVNASYVTRQLQSVLNRLADVQWLASRSVVALGEDPGVRHRVSRT